MTKNASEFVGDIPKNYDEGLGPNIFEDFASDIARRASELSPSDVLELAAGTGLVSRKLKDKLPARTSLIVTDLNAPMLEVASSKFGADEVVEFATADAMALDYADASFDLVICQFGVMFFPDKEASFREVLRVLRPGGTYLFNVWGTMSENPFSAIAHKTASEYFPDDPPGFYRVPFSYADATIVIKDLKAAGFSEVEQHPLSIHKQVTDINAFARGIIYGNPLIDEINSRDGVSPSDVMNTVEQRFREAWGAEPATMPLKTIVFTGRRG